MKNEIQFPCQKITIAKLFTNLSFFLERRYTDVDQPLQLTHNAYVVCVSVILLCDPTRDDG